jgi:hypothetical protein
MLMIQHQIRVSSSGPTVSSCQLYHLLQLYHQHHCLNSPSISTSSKLSPSIIKAIGTYTLHSMLSPQYLTTRWLGRREGNRHEQNDTTTFFMLDWSDLCASLEISTGLLLRRIHYCIMQSCQTLLSLHLTNPSSSSSWLLRIALSSKTRHITHPRTIPSPHQVDCCIMPCCRVWFLMMLSRSTLVPMSYNASSSHFIFVLHDTELSHVSIIGTSLVPLSLQYPSNCRVECSMISSHPRQHPCCHSFSWYD